MAESLIFYYLIVWQPLGYLLGVVGAIIEGDITWFTLAFLTGQGFFNLWLMSAVIFASAVVGDTLFFLIGRQIKHLPNFVFLWADKISRPFDRHLNERPWQTILISKFAYGAHKPLLVRMGMTGKSYRDLVRADLPAIVVWQTVIGALGYFSGLSFFLVQRYLRFAEVGLLVGLILFFIIIKIVTNYSLKKL